MTKREYALKLKSPLWHQKRAEILKRDNFKCTICNTEEEKGNPLNVHHKWYSGNRDPWQYENYELVTLCDLCHGYEHDAIDKIKEYDLPNLFHRHTALDVHLILNDITAMALFDNTTAEEMCIVIRRILRNRILINRHLEELRAERQTP